MKLVDDREFTIGFDEGTEAALRHIENTRKKYIQEPVHTPDEPPVEVSRALDRFLDALGKILN